MAASYSKGTSSEYDTKGLVKTLACDKLWCEWVGRVSFCEPNINSAETKPNWHRPALCQQGLEPSLHFLETPYIRERSLHQWLHQWKWGLGVQHWNHLCEAPCLWIDRTQFVCFYQVLKVLNKKSSSSWDRCSPCKQTVSHLDSLIEHLDLILN